MKVKDLIDFLSKQDPEARIFAFDLNVSDYRPISKKTFKNVLEAKKFERRKWLKFFKDLPKNEKTECITSEMQGMFKYVKDEDVLIGLKI